MIKAKRAFCVLSMVTATVVVTVGPAEASRFGVSGFPQYPSFPFEHRAGSGGPANFVQDPNDPNLWVWTIDPMVYGATGTIKFWNYRNAVARTGTMTGPGGVGVNDWRVCAGLAKALCQSGTSPFDPSRPGFTQDVESVPADFLTPDPPADISNDWDPSEFHPDGFAAPAGSKPPMLDFPAYPGANMDGSANLFKFAYSIAPGTQFMNMQVDRSGNYYVARRDMQWQWIDSFTYKKGDDPATKVDTQFNIQPYPISDAFGWCGASIVEDDPNALTAMGGQLIKDIAFDVFAGSGGPQQAARPISTEVVPSFMMRSYGIYEVDVTMQGSGVRQHFTGTAKGVHVRPVDVKDANGNVVFPAGSLVKPGDPDYTRWFNRVSPFAAGVVPIGAWVINEGTQYMQVVPAGTPGAVWHQNKFAGAAFLVRGDMERRVNYINAASEAAGDQATVAGDTQVYRQRIDQGRMKRSDWTDWAEDGTTVLADAH